MDMSTGISALGGMDIQTLYQYLGQAGNNLTADQQQQLLTIATTSLQQQYEQQVQNKAQNQLQQIQQKKQQQPPKKKQKKQHNVGGANGSVSNGASASPQLSNGASASPQLSSGASASPQLSNGAPSPSVSHSLPASISITPSHQLKAASVDNELPQNLSTSVSSGGLLSQQLNSPISITPSVSITPSPNLQSSVSITPSQNQTSSVSVNPLPHASNSVSITPSQQSSTALTPSQQQLLLSNGTSLTSVGNSQQNGTAGVFQNKHLVNGTPNAKSDSRSSTPSRPSAPPTPITLPPLAAATANPLDPTGQTKYQQLLAVIEEMAKDMRPCYSASKQSAERLKRGIVYARILVRECLNETAQSNKN